MLRLIVGLLFVFATVGCERKHGEAIVLEKEHIAARAISTSVTPPATDAETKPTPIENEPTTLAPGQIAVDGLVMSAEARGTSQDPRALPDEQWLVKVKMLNDGRVFNVHADKRQFEKLHAGDRVQVTYRVGKYTNTVWEAEIE